jgi:flavin-dependent dehydrogenase
MRDRFDYLLAQKAVEAGAQLEDGVKVETVSQQADGVTVETKRDTYRSRFVVGADGATGITARSVGLMARRHDGAAIEGEIQVSSHALEKWHDALLLDFGGIPWGYAWIFPKGEHLSIGIGTWNADSKLKLRDYLDRFVAKQPDLRGPMTTKGHLVPLGGKLDRFDSGRVLIAGDAAATADPFTGEGISHAIQSGIIAAEEIGAASRKQSADLSAYTKRLNREVNADFRYARVATNIFYRWPRRSFSAFIEDSMMLDPATGVIEGRLRYRDLLLNTLRSSPRIVWHKLIGRKTRPGHLTA